MSARQSRGGTSSSSGTTAASSASASSVRQNEYFVPRDGIDREVITADICRYLGNDALVRPGHYENPQTGQSLQGYYITAYRNLTTAMIEDLKADSARWDQERRQQSARNTPGGTYMSRDANGVYSRRSNSPPVQYRFSETHSARQQQGPTDTTTTYQAADPYANRDVYDSTPRYGNTGQPYPVSANSGYTQPQTSYGGQGTSGYGQYAQSTTSYSPQPDPRDPRYSGSSSHISQGYAMDQQPPYVTTGANIPQRGYADPYATGSSAAQRTSTTMSSQQAQAYMTSGPSSTAGYTSSGYYQQAPPSSGYAVPPQSQDPFLGRGTSAQPGFPATQGQQQYDESPIPRNAAASSNTQIPGSGPSHTRRGERDPNDRHHGADRHHRPPRR